MNEVLQSKIQQFKRVRNKLKMDVKMSKSESYKKKKSKY